MRVWGKVEVEVKVRVSVQVEGGVRVRLVPLLIRCCVGDAGRESSLALGRPCTPRVEVLLRGGMEGGRGISRWIDR